MNFENGRTMINQSKKRLFHIILFDRPGNKIFQSLRQAVSPVDADSPECGSSALSFRSSIDRVFGAAIGSRPGWDQRKKEGCANWSNGLSNGTSQNLIVS